eukprot:2477085-Pyramimonas_sp.AAC.1
MISSHHDLSRLTAILCEEIRRRRTVRFEHTKGHSGAPWNEAADVIAKEAGLQPRRRPYFGSISSLLVYEPALEWSWLRTAHPQDAAAYPPLINGKFQFTVKPQVAQLEHIPAPAPSKCVNGRLNLCLCQYNAQSMIDVVLNPKTSRKVSGKGILVRQQLHQRGVHLAGIQETRCAARASSANGYYTISSPAVKGNLGCSLLLSTELPYATHKRKAYCFQKKHAKVLFGHPRMLFVRVAAPFFDEVIAVAHTPHHGKDQQGNERKDWWRLFELKCDIFKPSI